MYASGKENEDPDFQLPKKKARVGKTAKTASSRRLTKRWRRFQKGTFPKTRKKIRSGQLKCLTNGEPLEIRGVV